MAVTENMFLSHLSVHYGQTADTSAMGESLQDVTDL